MIDEDALKTLTPLVIAATQAHEMYLAFKEVGFSEGEAIKLVVGFFSGRME